MTARYHLGLTFKSNERPWSGTYDAYKINTDEEAIEWARYMRDHMTEYAVTLFKDDVMIVIPNAEENQ